MLKIKDVINWCPQKLNKSSYNGVVNKFYLSF